MPPSAETLTEIDKLDSRKAMWLWNDESDMIVVEHGTHRPGEHDHLQKSTGACWGGWAEDSIKEQQYFLRECVGDELYSQAASLVAWREVSV